MILSIENDDNDDIIEIENDDMEVETDDDDEFINVDNDDNKEQKMMNLKMKNSANDYINKDNSDDKGKESNNIVEISIERIVFHTSIRMVKVEIFMKLMKNELKFKVKT